MFKVHTCDGLTSRIDLSDHEQAQEWLRKLKDPEFQARISGFTVTENGVQYSLPKPLGFDRVSYLPEIVDPDPDRKVKGGERITCFAGDIRAIIMVHREQRAARVSLRRIGKRRFDPA